MTPYSRQQRIDRLVREIAHFEKQMQRFDGEDTPQGKRCYTRAKRCRKDRLQQLDRVLAR